MDNTRQSPDSRSAIGAQCAGDGAAAAAVTRDARWQRAARRARLLSWLSLAYMAAEGAIAIIARSSPGRWRCSASAWTRPSRAWPA